MPAHFVREFVDAVLTPPHGSLVFLAFQPNREGWVTLDKEAVPRLPAEAMASYWPTSAQIGFDFRQQCLYYGAVEIEDSPDLVSAISQMIETEPALGLSLEFDGRHTYKWEESCRFDGFCRKCYKEAQSGLQLQTISSNGLREIGSTIQNGCMLWYNLTVGSQSVVRSGNAVTTMLAPRPTSISAGARLSISGRNFAASGEDL